MKVVLTGASSFTGYWFARALSGAGVHVVMPVRGQVDGYTGVRGTRVAALEEFGDVVPETAFGSDRFLALLAETAPDLLCHHAATVGDYRSPDYDVLAATAANTMRMREVVERLASAGAGLLITGSVFESNEGCGERPLRAFSPYGLSKALSAQIAAYWCGTIGVPLARFVIPNPFGIFEEPRFCTYLVRTWARGDRAGVNTPAYVRDNIHVDLLALAYTRFAQTAAMQGGRLAPSGYVETQGAFATRFAREIGGRLGLEAALDLANQTTFEEPVVRINTDHCDAAALGWSEGGAWDRLAEYYRRMLSTDIISRH